MMDLCEQNFIPFTSLARGKLNAEESKIKKIPKVLAPRISDGSILWNMNDKLYSATPVGLHDEIVDFFDYMVTQPKESEARMRIIKRVESLVLKLWPSAKVEIFGSVCTGLYLPTSDLDFVIFGKWKVLPLRTLEEAITRENLCDDEGVKVIDKASVPIVKYADRHTGIKVDLSFNMASGIQSAELIQTYVQTYPKLPYLMLVLKQFLAQRELNEVFTGGISSYCLLLLVVSFFQLHPRKAVTFPNANVGVLLIEFFELYGCLFNYDNVAISVRGEGSYVAKRQMQARMDSSDSFLCVEDPVQPSNNVARGSFNMAQVKLAFEYAYHVLSKAVLPASSKSTQRSNSILKLIVQLDSDLVSIRAKIVSESNGAETSSVLTSGILPVDRIEISDEDEVSARSRSCTSTPTLSATSSTAKMKRPSSAANVFIKRRRN